MHADNSICEDVTNILDIDVQKFIVEEHIKRISPIVSDTKPDESELPNHLHTASRNDSVCRFGRFYP